MLTFAPDIRMDTWHVPHPLVASLARGQVVWETLLLSGELSNMRHTSSLIHSPLIVTLHCLTELNFVKIVLTHFGKPEPKFHVRNIVLGPQRAGFEFRYGIWTQACQNE